MQPTILYNPNNGITMGYDPALAAMAPNLVALTQDEYERIRKGMTVSSAKAANVVPPKEAEHKSPSAQAAPEEKVYTIETVPDSELLAFCKGKGLDFSDLFEQAADDAERAEALRAIRKRAAKDIARIEAAKRKASHGELV